VLTQQALDQFQNEGVNLSFVLFDEIERANDALWQLLPGILDKGILTLGDNQRVDFSRTVVVMTSNLGAAEIGRLISQLGLLPPPAARPVSTSMGRSATLL
jgi:ATP-dependent Clp protease ATP-binding subunit ClpB